MAYGVVYLMRDKTNDKLYVGQTIHAPERRFKEHFYEDTYIGNAMRAHGIENFTIEVIEECETREQLNEREIFWIAELDCMAPKGYNCTTGGEGGSPSEETVERIRASVNSYYEEHPEARDRISAEQKARFSDPEEIAKLAERVRKAFENPEVVAKHSESQRKRFEDPAERQKVADGVSAHFSKPGEREAQSARITSYFDTPGAREKASEAQKKRFEDPAEHDKVSKGLKKYFAEYPEAVKNISDKNKGRKDSDETRARKRIGQKARHERERKEKLPSIIAKENRAAAEWNALTIGLKNFRIEQLADIEKFLEDVRKLKERLRSKRKREKKRSTTVTEQNRAAAQLAMPLPNLKKYHDEHSDKIKMPLTLPKGYAALATPIKKSTAGNSHTFKFTASTAPVEVVQLTLNFG
jgi:group I intron endonuclease